MSHATNGPGQAPAHLSTEVEQAAYRALADFYLEGAPLAQVRDMLACWARYGQMTPEQRRRVCHAVADQGGSQAADSDQVGPVTTGRGMPGRPRVELWPEDHTVIIFGYGVNRLQLPMPAARLVRDELVELLGGAR